jgi:superfamily II DNA or RNA helicase/HKD family nuclease
MTQPQNIIIDNLEQNTVLDALKRLLTASDAIDIATGFFEIGSLLALDGYWNNLEKIRIITGDEMTRRTRKELIDSLKKISDESIETEKEKDDELKGLASVKKSLQNNQILVKIYRKAKFHAKSYIMQAKPPSVVNFSILGSSNFTEPGLCRNLELNLFTTDQLQIIELQKWYNKIWDDSEEVKEEIIKVIEPHLKEYKPFEVYCKALYEYFLGQEQPVSDWEMNESIVYKILSKYQRDGYHQALRIANEWNGAMICDGVGLGKTFIGLMIIEHFLHKRKRVLLITPKSAKESVWVSNLQKYIYPYYPDAEEMDLKIAQHTDFGRDSSALQNLIIRYASRYDAIVVDEAHHFRTPYAMRSRALYQIAKGKQLFLLTATPLNNSLDDLYHLINLFAQNRQDHFARIGIHKLRAHFNELERELINMNASRSNQDHQLALTDIQDAAFRQDIFRADGLLQHVMIQRSRAYVKESEKQEENKPRFPVREKPRVIEYSLAKIYSDLFPLIQQTFRNRDPLLSFAVYNPESYKKNTENQNASVVHYEKQLAGLLRTLTLKRFESSFISFEYTLEDLLIKMADFLRANNKERLEKWIEKFSELWETVQKHKIERSDEEPEEEGDVLPDIDLKLDPAEYKLNELLPLVETDMTNIANLLSRVYKNLSPDKDNKVQKLLESLKNDPILKNHKVAIFTEFKDTARYIYSQILSSDIIKDKGEIVEIDSTKKIDREKVIRRFAPYYNCTNDELPEYINNQIRLLISTDVLSEGLNLQDANVVINYDLHWNPVRLMQRIGRVDRRIDPSKPINNDKVYFYNFLPPNEIDDLLHLFENVSGKVLRISRTLGIEAPLLTPDDEVEALRLFNESYDQKPTIEETLRLKVRDLEKNFPELFKELKTYPRRIFSGKRSELLNPRGIFAAYRYPDISKEKEDSGGELRWYFYDIEKNEIMEDLEKIHKFIESTEETARKTIFSWEDRKKWREIIETKKVKNRLRELQTPIGEKAMLVCWMEIS